MGGIIDTSIPTTQSASPPDDDDGDDFPVQHVTVPRGAAPERRARRLDGRSHRWDSLFRQATTLLDAAVLCASAVFAFAIRDRWLEGWYGSLYPAGEYLWALWVILPTWLLALRQCGLHDAERHQSVRGLLAGVLKAHVFSGLVLASVMYLSKATDVSRLLVQSFLAVSVVLLALEKLAVRGVLAYLGRTKNPAARNVAILGDRNVTRHVSDLLDRFPHWGWRCVGFVSPNGSGDGQRGDLGGLADFPAMLDQHVIDEVLAVSPGANADALELAAAACAERGVTFRIAVRMPEALAGTEYVESLGDGVHLLSREVSRANLESLALKRGIDIVGSCFGLIICLATVCWYWPRLKRESPGPLFFRQTRVGRNGRLFTLHKFRTMEPNAEERLADILPLNEMQGFMFKMEKDPRVTPTGETMRRSHLDELPQFWNVLVGEMSLVGTRPPTPREVAHYLPRHRRRISMKPGITGLWQIAGNKVVTDFEDVVRLDCKYIDEWSLWLDFKILVKTIAKVARGAGS